jgi:hypothetical protein
VAELDRYVKGIQELLAPLGSPTDRLSALQQALARLTQMPANAPASPPSAPAAPAVAPAVAPAAAAAPAGAESRRGAAGDFFSGLTSMPERMRDIQRILADFSTPGPQLRAYQEQLSTTRQQLQLMASQLEAAETTISRIADLAEHFQAMQQPFIDAAAAWTGTDTRRDK